MFRVRDDGRIRWLTIDNPQRRNAVPFAEWGSLADALSAFEESNARVLVIIGAGSDFCSGAELGPGVPLGDTTAAYEAMAGVGEAARALHAATKPTVAAVDGYAVGAGMNLALGCDVVIATERARFAEIFVRRGLTVDFGGTWLLPRIVGLARAKEMALTGRFVDAYEALAIGMVSRVVPPSNLVEAAGEMAASLAAGAPLAQQFIKQAFDSSHQMSFSDAVAFEQRAQAILLRTEDLAEGMAAFLEKRDPEFKGR